LPPLSASAKPQTQVKRMLGGLLFNVGQIITEDIFYDKTVLYKYFFTAGKD